jgi:DNA-binding NarL/FixJ family response regulator
MIPPGRLMIVEDEVIVAEDLRRTLEGSGYEVAAHATTGREAIEMARRCAPDLVLMDVILADEMDGTAVARAIRESIDASIIYVSAHSDDRLVDEAVRSGAVGYIIKPFQARQVTAAVKVALHRRGEEAGLLRLRRLHTLVADEQVWDEFLEGAGEQAPRTLRVTPREREVLECLVGCGRVSVVANVLGISIHTARNHLKSAFRKLGLHSQDELFRCLLSHEYPSDAELESSQVPNAPPTSSRRRSAAPRI